MMHIARPGSWLTTVSACACLLALSLAQEPFTIDPSQYLLPIGGPKELVPEAHQQRNLINAINFFFAVGGPIAANITRTALQGQIPSVPTFIPGWADDIKGQIFPLGQYDDYFKSAEYFFNMPRAVVFRAGTVGGSSWLNLPVNPEALVFENVKASIIEASASANMIFGANVSYAGPYEWEPRFRFKGVLYFNRQGLVCGYDLTVPNFGGMWKQGFDPMGANEGAFPTQEQLDAIPDSPYKDAYLPRPGVTSLLEEICDVATGPFCFPVVGTQFYKDKADCMEKLGKKRLGSYEDIDQDTIACRAMHRFVVPSNPAGHCSHLAADATESEGGICIDRTSADYNKRRYQCGYDDVGYTPSGAPMGAWVNGGYPKSLADFIPQAAFTISPPECEAVAEGPGSYGAASGPTAVGEAPQEEYTISMGRRLS